MTGGFHDSTQCIPIAHLQSKKPCAPFRLTLSLLTHPQAAATSGCAPAASLHLGQKSPHLLLRCVYPSGSLSPTSLFTALVKNHPQPGSHEVPLSVMDHFWLRRHDSHTGYAAGAGTPVSSRVPIPPPTPSLRLSWAITSFQTMPTKSPHQMPKFHVWRGSMHPIWLLQRRFSSTKSFNDNHAHQLNSATSRSQPLNTLKYSSWPFFFILSFKSSLKNLTSSSGSSKEQRW